MRAAAVTAHILWRRSLGIALFALARRIHLADFELTLLDHVLSLQCCGCYRQQNVCRRERGQASGSAAMDHADETLVAQTVDQDFPPGSRYRSAAIRQRDWLRSQLDPADLNDLAGLPAQ